MKKIVIIIIFSVLCINLSAQRRDNPRIKAYKIAFITEKLDLNEVEAEKFWPLYNLYEKSKHKLFRQEKQEIKNKIREAGGVENISDKEASEYLNLLLEIKTSHHKIKSDFYSNLKNILSPKKILQLEIAEHNFNRKLMRKLRGNGRKKD